MRAFNPDTESYEDVASIESASEYVVVHPKLAPFFCKRAIFHHELKQYIVWAMPNGNVYVLHYASGDDMEDLGEIVHSFKLSKKNVAEDVAEQSSQKKKRMKSTPRISEAVVAALDELQSTTTNSVGNAVDVADQMDAVERR